MKPDLPAHAAQRRALHDLIDAATLAPWRAAIDALAKPAIGLRTRPSKGHVVRASRVGGEPDLPIDVDWPEGEEGPLLFVMQVRLADVARFDLEGLLPADGHLSVFSDRICDDVQVLYFPPGVELVRHAWAPVDDEPFTACDVEVLAELQLPPTSSAFVGLADREPAQLGLPADAYLRYQDGLWLPWREQQRPGRPGEAGIHQLLGYAAGDDSHEQAAGDEVLVAFDSDDRARMEWGDVQCVWTLLTRAQLVARDWHELRAVT